MPLTASSCVLPRLPRSPKKIFIRFFGETIECVAFVSTLRISLSWKLRV
jgi:hypothetical protein